MVHDEVSENGLLDLMWCFLALFMPDTTYALLLMTEHGYEQHSCENIVQVSDG